MSLRWDPLLVRALAEALHDRLAGAHLRALRLDGPSRDLVLLFREATLAWSLHPTRGAPLLLPAAEPAAGDLGLRARVRAVRAPPDERILHIELLPGRGSPARDLIVELLGNQWNALVVEAADGRIRHVLVRREGRRRARVGDVYTPPPPSGREGSEGVMPLERWRELLEPVPPPDRPRELVRRVAWCSPINAAAFVDAHADPGVALERGWALWRELAHEGRPPRPVLLDVGGDVQPYPWPLPGSGYGEHEAVDTLLEAFRSWAERAPDAAPAAAVLPPERIDALERAADTALRRVTSLQAELEAVEDPDGLRSEGDLLLARFGEVPAGAEAVELVDFEGKAVTLTLDPTLAVQENASARYDRAARAERARERIPTLLAEARAQAEELGTLLERARGGEATVEDLEAALPAPKQRTRGEPEGPGLPYRVFRSSGGLEIRVGRGARTNDDLTFHHSAPDDVWLHARHVGGAHVVLRWGQAGNPPARDLHEAAILAALHSRARTSGTVPVDWTLRKYVRKPRGAPPGSVLPDRVRTLFVEPDAGLATRLAEG